MERLRTSLEIYYHEMEQLEAMVTEEAHTGYHSYFRAIASLLERAKEAATHGDVEYGWGAFNAAQRLETLLYFKMSCDGRNGPLQEYARAMYLSRAEGIAAEGEDKLSGETTVDPSGNVKVPLVSSLRASGLTTEELGDKVRDALARSFLKDPMVTVEVRRLRDQYVLVSGPVANPGKVAVQAATPMRRIVSLAGGFAPRHKPLNKVSKKSQKGHK